jgi:hypothetical protein
VDVAELPRIGDLLELGDARVVLEQVADHQGPARLVRGGHGALGALHRLGERLLDEAVLARAQDGLGELGVRRHRRGQDDRVEAGVGEQLAQVRGPARRRHEGAGALERGRRAVAQPCDLAARDRGEVPGEVRAPVAEARHADANRAHAAILRASAATTRPPARPSP